MKFLIILVGAAFCLTFDCSNPSKFLIAWNKILTDSVLRRRYGKWCTDKTIDLELGDSDLEKINMHKNVVNAQERTHKLMNFLQKQTADSTYGK